MTIQEQLLKEFKDCLEIIARHYSKKGLEYNEAYNQSYIYLLENYPLYKNSIDLIYCIRDKMRTYYRNEIKERHFNYGTNPEDYNT
jgi:hypothetical protein